MKKCITYEQVANRAGLTGIKKERFVEYMSMRWGRTELSNCRSGYAEEWADRFNNSMEWLFSDKEGKQILSNIDRALMV